eukprot:1795556-Rhodomonas_salina.1
MRGAILLLRIVCVAGLRPCQQRRHHPRHTDAQVCTRAPPHHEHRHALFYSILDAWNVVMVLSFDVIMLTVPTLLGVCLGRSASVYGDDAADDGGAVSFMVLCLNLDRESGS